MKNVTSIFDFIYLVMIMAAGTVGIVMLLDANTFYRYERFMDKSLVPSTNIAGYELDINISNASSDFATTGYAICPEMNDSSMTPDEIIAMFYVQDETCPTNLYGEMNISIGGRSFGVNDRWEANKASHVIHVVDTIYPYYSVDDAEFYVVWNPRSHKWVFVGKHFKPAGRNLHGQIIYEETGVPLGEI